MPDVLRLFQKIKGNLPAITFGFFIPGYLPLGLNFLLHS